MTLGEVNGFLEVMQLLKVCSQTCTVGTET